MAPFNLSSLNVANIKSELTVSNVKDRAKGLNDRFSSPSSSSTGYNRSQSQGQAAPRTLAPAPGEVPSAPPRRVIAALRQATATQVEPVQAYEQEIQEGGYDQTSSTTDWHNISRQDKEALFSLLDSVFAGSAPSTALRVDPRANVVAPPLAPLPKQTQVHHVAPAHDAPPAPQLWARPSPSANLNTSMSYPPPCTSSSHAHDIANYFSTSSQWGTAWFTLESPLPPPLSNRKDMTWTSSWQQRGSQKTLIGAALFCDLSVAWWKVEWDMQQERRPGFARTVKREAKYLDSPPPFGAEELWAACSTYGERVAIFAEEAERRGVPIAHGECWDVVSEALAAVTGLNPPIPSIARTHGHLLFSGSAKGRSKADQKGTWRGGDTAIRRGDIVEWRKVRVRTDNGWSDLGSPEHTAVIVATYLSSDPSANTEPKDGDSIAPCEVGILEVIEQSKGKPPTRAVYDLKGMESGEIWIYRPVGMQEYLGIEGIRPDWEERTTRGEIRSVR